MVIDNLSREDRRALIDILKADDKAEKLKPKVRNNCQINPEMELTNLFAGTTPLHAIFRHV